MISRTPSPDDKGLQKGLDDARVEAESQEAAIIAGSRKIGKGQSEHSKPGCIGKNRDARLK
ncbi:hypothetical protein SIN01_01810 [Sporolactobacillus inulinus]|nr:hypothetical protein SIN01_01810 [Sporolactobacillus inulinus]